MHRHVAPQSAASRASRNQSRIGTPSTASTRSPRSTPAARLPRSRSSRTHGPPRWLRADRRLERAGRRRPDPVARNNAEQRPRARRRPRCRGAGAGWRADVESAVPRLGSARAPMSGGGSSGSSITKVAPSPGPDSTHAARRGAPRCRARSRARARCPCPTGLGREERLEDARTAPRRGMPGPSSSNSSRTPARLGARAGCGSCPGRRSRRTRSSAGS